MPDTYRDQLRQAQWANAEAKRVLAQEQADALTALGVPACVRSGWVALADPFGLLVKLDPSGAVTGWPQTAATEATLPTVTTPATEPHSGARRRARAFAELRRIAPPACRCRPVGPTDLRHAVVLNPSNIAAIRAAGKETS